LAVTPVDKIPHPTFEKLSASACYEGIGFKIDLNRMNLAHS